MDAASRCINHHRARTIDEITCSNQLFAWLQDIRQDTHVPRSPLLQDRKNRTYCNVDINISNPSQGIEDQNVVTFCLPGRNRNQVSVFLGGHAPQMAGVTDAIYDRCVGKLHQPLEMFFVHTLTSYKPQILGQVCLVYLLTDDLCRHSQF